MLAKFACVALSAAAVAVFIPTAEASVCNAQWEVVPSYDHSQLSGEIDSLNAVTAASSVDQWAVGSWEQYPNAYNFHTLIEHWDGGAVGWTNVPSPNSAGLNNYLYGVFDVAANDVWAVGGSDQAGGTYQSLVEHWNGAAWSIVAPASSSGVLYGVSASGPNDVWAVGNENYPGRALIEHWDGSSWTATYLRTRASLRGVTVLAPNDIWAVGYVWESSGAETAATFHFNGHGWTQVPSSSPVRMNAEDQNWLVSVTAVTPNDIWAVGWSGNFSVGLHDQTLIEHWTGGRWKIVPSPNPPATGTSSDDSLWSVTAVAQNDVWAVGAVGGGIDVYSTTVPLVVHWNGSAWTQVVAPGSGQLLGATAEPAGAGISAVGVTAGTFDGTLAEHVCPG